jgi:hypothetical protein
MTVINYEGVVQVTKILSADHRTFYPPHFVPSKANHTTHSANRAQRAAVWLTATQRSGTLDCPPFKEVRVMTSHPGRMRVVTPAVTRGRDVIISCSTRISV